jgi:hypothetical protein
MDLDFGGLKTPASPIPLTAYLTVSGGFSLRCLILEMLKLEMCRSWTRWEMGFCVFVATTRRENVEQKLKEAAPKLSEFVFR